MPKRTDRTFLLPCRAAMAGAALLCLAPAANGQQQPIQPWSSQQAATSSLNEGLRDAGRTADAGAGEIGQRQSATDTASDARPIGRIANRIENRVQNRLRNRIDRNYDPRANATSPFDRAAARIEEQATSRGITRSQ